MTSFGALHKPACDGYNWRKYGQKMGKASECPRSYYKCTHLKCLAKKKVERSVDGHITEITYNGWHNHELPQPSKKRKDGSALNGTDCSEVRPDIRTHDRTVVNSSDVSSPSRPDQVSTQLASLLLVKRKRAETKNYLIEVDEGHDEPDAKRKKKAVKTLASSHGTVAGSKIVLPTRSEVDVVKDGYNWRKYGQKVVKGNQNLSCYYKLLSRKSGRHQEIENVSAVQMEIIRKWILVVRSPSDLPAHDAILILNLKNLMDYAMHYRIGPWKNYHNTSFSLFWGICLFYFVFCENTITCKFNGVESGFSALES
ncbi:probable WRKY transcription factor 3 isoform X1 [Nicotiana tomentosiformis]|uniref:probable WRKY transcription factor 3 isoform X1 n=1 Tax=Nicotiana tomentosiformis TaxID=4098 RepID=UPI00388CE901